MANRKNTFLLKRSNVINKSPLLGDLQLGEIALNTADAKLYTSYTGGLSGATEIREIGWDRVNRTGDTVTGNFNFYGDIKISGSSLPNGYALSVTGDTNILGNLYVGKNLYVSGGTSQTSLTANTIYTDYIDFNTNPNVISSNGRVYWDPGAGTLNVSVGDTGTGLIDLQVGQEEIVRVYNLEATTLQKGEIVYVSGSQGNRPAVKRALATSDGYSVTTLGMVDRDIVSGAEGYVTTFGIISNLNTLGLTGGTAIWLSGTVPGGYTSVKPIAPLHTVLIGYVVRVSATVGSIFVNISNGWELDELHDVRISAATEGDLLIRSSYSGTPVWVNTKILKGDYTFSGNTNQIGNFNITGNTNQIGNVNQLGNFNITGNTFHLGNTNQIGNYTISGNTNQLGNTTQTGNFHITGDTSQLGNSTQIGNVTLSGNTSIIGNTTQFGTINQLGNFNITGNTFHLGNTNQLGNFYLTGNTNQIGSFYLSGNSNCTLTIDGNICLNGNLNITGNTNQIGDYTISGNTIQIGDFNITGNTSQIGNTSQVGSFRIVSATTGCTFAVTGNTCLNGDLDIVGNTFMSGNFCMNNMNSGGLPTGTNCFDTTLIPSGSTVTHQFQGESGILAHLGDLASGEPNSKGYIYMENNVTTTILPTNNTAYIKMSGITLTIGEYLNLFTTGSSTNELIYNYPPASGTSFTYLKYNISYTARANQNGKQVTFALIKSPFPYSTFSVVPAAMTNYMQGSNQDVTGTLTGIVGAVHLDKFYIAISNSAASNTFGVTVSDITISLFT